MCCKHVYEKVASTAATLQSLVIWTVSQ